MNNFKLFKDVIRRNRNSKIVKLGQEIAETFLAGYWNEACYDMPKNGELYLIRAAKDYFKTEKIAVFDVGANRGQWATLTRDILPDASIHCFEIVPQTFDILKQNMGAYKDITLNNIGLSSGSAELEVTYFLTEDTGSSIQALPWDSVSISVPCKVISGDHYCQQNAIDAIGLLKIDTEGHDLSVLKGFDRLLEAGNIKLIQFEYGFTYIPPRATLGDVYSLLSPYGYAIGRLYPTGVEFKPYDMFTDENFRMGNYVAVHQSAGNLLQRLSL